MTRTRRNGQGTVEYLLALAAILVALLAAAQPGGALQLAIQHVLDSSKTGMEASVTTASKKFK